MREIVLDDSCRTIAKTKQEGGFRGERKPPSQKEDGKEDRKKNQAMSVPSSRVGSLDGSKPETMYTTRRAADTA